MPSWPATASAVARLSPVSMTMRIPSARSARAAPPAVVALIGSAIASTPARPPSTRDEHRRRPGAARSASAWTARPAGIDALFGQEPGVAHRARPPVDPAGHALAGRRVEALGSTQRQAARPWPPPRWPRPADVRWPAPGWPPGAAASASRQPAAGTTAVTAGLPSVSVPVLSTTSVSTASMRSSASAELDQHAGAGAAADPDHDRHRRGQAERAGAGDDQHRDRGDQAVGQPRLGPDDRPADEGQRRQRDHRRDETAGDAGRPAAGSARGCAGPRPPWRRCAPAGCRGRPCRRASPARRCR